MKEITIYGDNRHEKATKSRIACRGILIRDGKLLLVHEEKIDHWMIPGGGLEAGESLEECCIREMQEETGTVVLPKQHYLTLHEYYGPWCFTSHYFLCDSQGTAQQHLTEQEAETGLKPKWIRWEDALELFSVYQKWNPAEEMRRGSYLREYTALKAFGEMFPGAQ